VKCAICGGGTDLTVLCDYHSRWADDAVTERRVDEDAISAHDDLLVVVIERSGAEE